jgi:hypothetical protein
MWLGAILAPQDEMRSEEMRINQTLTEDEEYFLFSLDQ